MSDPDLIAAYKDRQKVERGFRFLKDPMFTASTPFLKSPELAVSTLVYALIMKITAMSFVWYVRNRLRARPESAADA